VFLTTFPPIYHTQYYELKFEVFAVVLQLIKSILPEGDMVLLGESSLCFKGSQCLHIQSEVSPWSWMRCDAL